MVALEDVVPDDLFLGSSDHSLQRGFAAVKTPSSPSKAMPAAEVSNSLRQRSSLSRAPARPVCAR